MLLCRTRPSPHKSGKTAGCNLFAGLPFRFRPFMQKFAMPFATSRGLQFFLIFSEAYLLTGLPRCRPYSLARFLYVSLCFLKSEKSGKSYKSTAVRSL
jgi:hypothetical protein